MYTTNPYSCIVLKELARPSNFRSKPSPWSACIALLPCYTRFSGDFSRDFPPIYRLAITAAYSLSIPQHLHHHGQPPKPPQEVLQGPKTALALFWRCSTTGCFRPLFRPPTTTHNLRPPPPAMISNHQASPYPISAPWTCKMRYKIIL